MQMLWIEYLRALTVSSDRVQRTRPAGRMPVVCLLIACGALAIGFSASAAQPVQARTAPPRQPAAKPTTAPPADELVLIKSIFDEDALSSKDPFFPKSGRVPAPRIATAGVALPDLVLQGIVVGPGTNRYAIINKYTIALGEEAEIRSGGKIFRIRCVEIQDKSAVISYQGSTKELTLRQGF